MKNKSNTNWDRVDAMTDDEIDYTDSPEVTAEMFQKMEFWQPEKKGIFIRLDTDVLDFLKQTNKHYQAKINAILKAYKEAVEKKLAH